MLNGKADGGDRLLIAAHQNLKEKAYWLKRLSGELSKASFYLRPPSGGPGKPRTAVHRFTIEGDLFDRLCRLMNGSDARLHMILTAALAALLQRCSGSGDILLGTTIYRQPVEAEFINTLLTLRIQPDVDMTFKDLLLDVRQTMMEAVEHQNYPCTVLIDQLNLSSASGGFPLFDVAILLENVQERRCLGPAAGVMTWCFRRSDDALKAEVGYDARRCEPDEAVQLGRRFCRLLSWAVTDVNRRLRQVEILTETEKEQLVREFNDNRLTLPRGRTFLDLFADQVTRTSYRVALLGAASLSGPGRHDHQLTYRELDRRAGQLAHLLKRRGVIPGLVTALMMDRSLSMLLGVLGVLQAGGAYLPLDPDYPHERLAYMLADSCSRLLLSRQYLLERFAIGDGHLSVVDLDDPALAGESRLDALPGVQPGDPVYVIYTSGSTGRPRAVVVQHDQFVNVSLGWRREYRLSHIPARLLQLASFSFDVFAGDVARAFLNGGLMVINSAIVLDPHSLHRLINRHRISLLESTPSYLIPFMDDVYDNRLDVPSLKLLILGSDTCRSADFKKLVARFGKQMRIINSYGVTEATIDTSFYEEPDPQGLAGDGIVPIGRALPNMAVYILDPWQRLQPIGLPGELYIGGDSLARGYLNQPELTADRFVNFNLAAKAREGTPSPQNTKPYILNPKSQILTPKSQPLYRTGDVARFLPGGSVAFLGRADNQVKIRGFRIELGEIESKLLDHPHVRDAVVLVKRHDSGEKYLCTYIVSREQGEEADLPAQLRDYLSRKLPQYMIPAYFVRLDRIPLTANGKVDRKTLLGYRESRIKRHAAFVAPASDSEKEIAAAWQEVLQLKEVGVGDNFFDLGGNSFDIIKIHLRLQTRLEREIPVIKLFEFPTIRELADYLKDGQPEPLPQSGEEQGGEDRGRGRQRLGERSRRARQLKTPHHGQG